MRVSFEVRDYDALYAAGEALHVCAQYSINNPTVSLRNNPHANDMKALYRKATGSVRNLWGCLGCNRMLPRMSATDHTVTACCGTAVFVHVHAR